MSFSPPPSFAAWHHQQARTGFEVAHVEARGDADHRPAGGWRVEGCTTALEEGAAWIVDYAIVVDAHWATRRAEVRSRSSSGSGSQNVLLECDGQGTWLLNGDPAPQLTGCLDVDLESSALTNTFPIHRLSLGVGRQAAVPAAYVWALDATVERLDQRYTRLTDGPRGQRYHYAAPAFDFTCDLNCDPSGLVLEYPGLASRAS
jgi:uncharacterized protein